jgi:GNAT superfamily N-acetyltransferase
MAIEIREVKTNRELKVFINFPHTLYKGNKYYTPHLHFDEKATLDKRKNPAFDFCEARYWLAYKDQKPVGRIAGILNKAFISKWNKNYVRFGWIDFEQDENVARLLVEQVENWAREMNMEAIHGPLGFTDLDHEGMLIEGYDYVSTFAGIYNHSYYPQYLEKNGFTKDADWIEYRVTLPTEMVPKLEAVASTVSRRYNLQVVQLKNKKQLLPYADGIFKLINDEYAQLYGVVPLTDKQVKYYTKQYFSFIHPDFISLVVNKEGELVAFGVSMPSLSAALQKGGGKLFPFGFLHLLKALKKNDTADLLIVAVKKELQGKGVNALLMHHTLKSYLKNGIRYVESNYQLEDNRRVQSIFDDFDKIQHKRRRCYIKYLNGQSG